jgi:hypothetical protein
MNIGRDVVERIRARRNAETMAPMPETNQGKPISQHPGVERRSGLYKFF